MIEKIESEKPGPADHSGHQDFLKPSFNELVKKQIKQTKKIN